MIPTYWIKIIRDLQSNKFRSLLMLLAISIGIVGAGSILSTYSILNYEIGHNFESTNPPSFKLEVTGINETVAIQVEHQPGIAYAEARGLINARVQLGVDQWSPMKLFVVNDFHNLTVSKFFLQNGSFPLSNNGIVIERSSITDNLLFVGHNFTIKTPNGKPTTMHVSGIVHDAAQAPGWQDHIDYGYISLNTLKLLGEDPVFTQLHVTVSSDTRNVTHITNIAYQIKDFVESKGYTVTSVVVPEPGVHPHTDQMNSLIFLLEIFGLLTLFLSGLLVINTITYLLKQQIKQIGIMKVLGGQISDIIKIYFGEIGILSLGALIIGIPTSITLGKNYAKFTADMLNFDITSGLVPMWVYATLIIVGLTIPLLTASYPIIKYSKISVIEALFNNEGTNEKFGSGIIDRILVFFKGFNRPLLLSLRNTFRKKFRLSLVIIILALAGATFISALNVGASWSNTVDYAISFHKYDFKAQLAQPYSQDEIEHLVMNVSGVQSVETWQQVTTIQQLSNNIDGLGFRLTAVPANTSMIDFPLLKGRWLLPNDTNALVVNHELYYYPNSQMDVNSVVNLRIGNITTKWTIVGIINEIGAPRRGFATAASAYVSEDYFNQITNSTHMTTAIRIKSLDKSVQGIQDLSKRLEQVFADNNIKIIDLQSTQARLQVLRDHLVVIVAFLLFMASLIAIVGGLSLMSLISMSVMERNREIGIMRTTGAKNKSIIHLFLTEGLIIGLVGYVLAFLLSYSFSISIGNFAGWIFLRTDLINIFPAEYKIIWLGLCILLSLFASIYPARSSIAKPISHLIAYE